MFPFIGLFSDNFIKIITQVLSLLAKKSVLNETELLWLRRHLRTLLNISREDSQRAILNSTEKKLFIHAISESMLLLLPKADVASDHSLREFIYRLRTEIVEQTWDNESRAYFYGKIYLLYVNKGYVDQPLPNQYQLGENTNECAVNYLSNLRAVDGQNFQGSFKEQEGVVEKLVNHQLNKGKEKEKIEAESKEEVFSNGFLLAQNYLQLFPNLFAEKIATVNEKPFDNLYDWFQRVADTGNVIREISSLSKQVSRLYPSSASESLPRFVYHFIQQLENIFRDEKKKMALPNSTQEPLHVVVWERITYFFCSWYTQGKIEWAHELFGKLYDLHHKMDFTKGDKINFVNINYLKNLLSQWQILLWDWYVENRAHELAIPKTTKKLFSLSYIENEPEAYRNLLQAKFSEQHFFQTHQVYSMQMKIFIREQLQQCEEILTEAPCAFTIIVLGSGSREEWVVGSDIEFAILVEEETCRRHPFFTNFVRLWQSQLQAAPKPWKMQLESGDLAEIFGPNPHFINTPDHLADYLDNDLCDTITDVTPLKGIYSLHRIQILYESIKKSKGNINLYKVFQDDLQNRFQKVQVHEHRNMHQCIGRNYLWRDVHDYLALTLKAEIPLLENKWLPYQQHLLHCYEKNKEVFDLKNWIQRPFTQFCLNLGRYAGLELSKPDGITPPLIQLIRQLVQKEYLTEAFSQKLEKAWFKINRTRILRELPELETKEEEPSSETFFNLFQQIVVPICLMASGFKYFEEYLGEDIRYVFSGSQAGPLLIKYLQMPPALRIPFREWVENFLLYFATEPQKQSEMLRMLVEAPLSQSGQRSNYDLATKSWEECIAKITKPFKGSSEIKLSWISPSGSNQQERALNPAIQQWLEAFCFDKKGELKHEAMNLTHGRRVVVPLYEPNLYQADLSFPEIKNKQISKIGLLGFLKFRPMRPGFQEFVRELSWRISGYSFAGDIVRLEVKGKVYPVYLSLAAGETLQNILDRPPMNLNSVEEKLDPKSFTQKVIETLLLLYEDDKEDNLAIQDISAENEKILGRLISFDCESALDTPFKKQNSLLKFVSGKDLVINCKSIVFCFKQMEHKLNSLAVAEFLSLDPFRLINECLQHQELVDSKKTQRKSDSAPGLFSNEEIAKFVEDKEDTYLPAGIEPGLIRELYQKFLRVQRALKDQVNPVLTHFDLFHRIESKLASFYEEAFHTHPTPSARLASLKTDYKVIEEKIAEEKRVDFTLLNEIKITLASASKYSGISSIVRCFFKMPFLQFSYFDLERIKSTQLNLGSKVFRILIADLSVSDRSPLASNDKRYDWDPDYFSFLSGPDIFILGVDVNEELSLTNIQTWLMLMRKTYAKPVILVATNIDLPRHFSYQEGYQIAVNHHCQGYFECSAKTGEGVNELFSAALRLGLLWEYIQSGNERQVIPFFSREVLIKFPTEESLIHFAKYFDFLYPSKVPAPRNKIVYRQSVTTVRPRFLASVLQPERKVDLKILLKQGQIYYPALAMKELQNAHDRFEELQTAKTTAATGSVAQCEALLQKYAHVAYLKEMIVDGLFFQFPNTSDDRQILILDALVGGHYQHLNLAGATALTDYKLEEILSTCPDLISLDISGCKLIEGSSIRKMAHKKMCPQLESLSLNRLPLLSYLYIPNSLWADESVVFPYLRRLFLQQCPSLFEAHVLGDSKNLRVLCEGSNQLKILNTQSPLNQIRAIKEIRSFMQDNIPSNVSIIVKKSSIDKIPLKELMVVLEAFERIVVNPLPHLERVLNLGFTCDDIGNISLITAHSDRLKALIINHCFIGNDEVDAISKLIEKNESITQLELKENLIDQKGAEALARSLLSNKTLLTLSLSAQKLLLLHKLDLTNGWADRSSIGNEGATAFGHALIHNQTLTSLDLSYCNIASKGAIALGLGLQQNRSLITLNLTGNYLYKECAETMGNALIVNGTLRSLILDKCALTDESIQIIARALKQNKTLTELRLMQNYIEEKGADALLEMLANNKNLIELDLRDNDIQSDKVLIIQGFLARNKKLQDEVTHVTCLGLFGIFKPPTPAEDKSSLLEDSSFEEKNPGPSLYEHEAAAAASVGYEDALQKQQMESLKEDAGRKLRVENLTREAKRYDLSFENKDILRDGNCFYHAIADQFRALYSHVSLRKDLADYVENHPEEFKEYAVEVGSVFALSEEMRKDKRWADAEDIKGLIAVFKHPLLIIQDNGDVHVFLPPNLNNDDEPFCLGYEVRNHYHSLKAVDGSNQIPEAVKNLIMEKRQEQQVPSASFASP